jgi:hypothetical protein
MNDFRETIKSLCDIGVLDLKPKKGVNKYKVKYSKEDIEIIFSDDRIFNML